MTAQIGDYMKASYDFLGETASDLSLRIGDVIRITNVVDGNWAVGHKVGTQNKIGTFPLAFVDHLTLPSILTGQKIFLVIDDFPAEKNGDLELSKGDVILGLESVNESWWRGKNGPLKGMFPLTMVYELESHDCGLRSRSASGYSSSLKVRSDSASIGGINSGITKVTETTFARALADVTPQLDGELAFQLGDLIEITEILDDDWLYGKCHNKEGLVSAVCVEILMENGEGRDCSDVKLHQKDASGSFNLGSTQLEPSKDTGSQNVQTSESRTSTNVTGSYTSENTRSHDAEVTPYGRVIYSFNVQIPTELSLTENSLVTLIKHIDSDWTEGEVDGKRGLFPTNFIEIIVDCPYAYNHDYHDLKEKHSSLELSSGASSSENANIQVSSDVQAVTPAPQVIHENGFQTIIESSIKLDSDKDSGYSAGTGSATDVSEENHEIGLVLYSFIAEVIGDISVKEGDTVEVIKSLDENWLKIQTENGQVGQVPRNYVEIIGPWPKAKSSELCRSASVPGTFSESFDEVVESAIGKNLSVITENISSMKASESSTAEYNVPIQKSDLSSMVKPLILPKPALSPKPIIASKPSVITRQSFKPTRHSSSSNRKTSLPILESRADSLSSLDAFITEEISKAKNRSSSFKNDDSLEDSDHSSAAFGDISTKKNFVEQQLSNSYSVSTRETSVFNDGSGSFYTPVNTPSAMLLSSGSSVQSPISPLNLNSDKQGIDARRNNYSKTVDSISMSDSMNRRKSTSFVELRTHDTIGLSTQNATFVNKAFQMDIAEGVLLDLNGKNDKQSCHPPARVTPPRPISAIVTSTSHTSETPPNKIRAPPPRPTGPRIAAAPPKTPLMPTRVESPVKFVPKRPAPKAPGIYNQTSNILPQQSTPQSSRRHPSRPAPTAPKRPPPRPADLMSFSPDGSGTDISEEATKELIADLKSKLEENIADIKILFA